MNEAGNSAFKNEAAPWGASRPVVSVEEMQTLIQAGMDEPSDRTLAEFLVHALQLPRPDQDKVREAVGAILKGHTTLTNDGREMVTGLILAALQGERK